VNLRWAKFHGESGTLLGKTINSPLPIISLVYLCYYYTQNPSLVTFPLYLRQKLIRSINSKIGD